MMNDKEQLVSMSFSAMKLDPRTTSSLIAYIKGEHDDPNLLKSLPQKTMNEFYAAYQPVLQGLKALAEDGNSAFLCRYTDILLAFWGKTLFSSLHSDEMVQRIVTCNHNAGMAYILWSASSITSGSYSIHQFSLHGIQIFNHIYEADLNLFQKAMNASDVNQRLFISSYLGSRDPVRFRSCMEYVEQVCKNSLPALFNADKRDQAVDMAIKFINGGLFVSDSMAGKLKVLNLTLNPNVLYILVLCSAMLMRYSNPLKRLLRLFIFLDHGKTMESLYMMTLYRAFLPSFPELYKGLDMPAEYLVAFYANKAASGRDNLGRDELNILNAGVNMISKAIPLASADGAYYLQAAGLDESGQEALRQMESQTMGLLQDMFDKLGIPPQNTRRYLAFFSGEASLEDIKALVMRDFTQSAYHMYQFDRFLAILSMLRGKSVLHQRAICFFTYGRLYHSLLSVAGLRNKKVTGEENQANLLTDMNKSGVALDGLLPFLTESVASPNSYFSVNLARNTLQDLIRSQADQAMAHYALCSADGRDVFAEQLFSLNRESFVAHITDFLSDSSKKVRERAIELLGKEPSLRSAVGPLLKDKKQAVRECAVHVLSMWNDEASLEALKAAFNEEKSEKIRGVIANVLKFSDKEPAPGDINIIDYCLNALKKTRTAGFGWLATETLPKVRYAASEEEADGDIIKYLIASYAAMPAVGNNQDARRIAKVLNEEDLAVLSGEILHRWMDSGAEAKKRWVLALSAIHGNDETIAFLKKQIEVWADNSRGAIACDAVRAMVLNGGNLALMTVDGMSRKFGSKQVKEAARVAFESAATELGMDPDDLADKIIPRLGFDERGEQQIDYGTRRFSVRISPSLELDITDENGKVLKALPAPGKNDNEAVATASYEAFKQLKKQLKTAVSYQAARLESALASHRLWSGESWKRLFVENPLMHQFAIGLVWGLYQGEELKGTFRYMEDGTFNSADEETLELEETASVGLIHPIELSADLLDKWKNQLKDYEIKQPFEQLNRKVFTLSEEEQTLERVERFGGITINGLSLMGKLSKYGWYKGSVLDGGCYYTFYKENLHTGTGAELSFSGMGIGNEDEIITLFELTFYRAGTVTRGSYVYNKPAQDHILSPKNVSKRIFSEILLEMHLATASKTGFQEHWKKDQRRSS